MPSTPSSSSFSLIAPPATTTAVFALADDGDAATADVNTGRIASSTSAGASGARAPSNRSACVRVADE